MKPRLKELIDNYKDMLVTQQECLDATDDPNEIGYREGMINALNNVIQDLEQIVAG